MRRRARALKQTQPYRAVTTLSVRTKPWPRSPTCSPEGFIPIQPSIQPCPTPLSLNLLPTDAVRLSENEQVARIPTSTEVRLNTRAGRSERTPHTLWNRNRTSCLFAMSTQWKCPHSASSRIASMPTLMAIARAAVADTRRRRPQSAQVARCVHAKRAAARHAQPPIWSQNPPGRPTHTHTQGRALVVDHCCS